MAADTREPESAPQGGPDEAGIVPAAAPPHSHKIYETFTPPPESANVLPGGMSNTAGGRPQSAGFTDALKTVKVDDFKNVHKQPCVRDSLLTGITAGFGVGGIRAVLGTPLPKASNWAVGSFCIASFATYEYCQIKRRLEMEGMKRAVEIIDRKKAEKEKAAREAMEAKRAAFEERKRLEEEEKQRKSWKFW
ncbi:MAG: hypothetical protein M1819_006085 [Sarea resinae]|nr:MAG: hypothetical protein M1819_006085 [Sarea resinae]